MYSSLYVKTNYSLLSSLISIDDYIEYAKRNNLTSICITDDNMYGVMEFYKKCVSNNIKPVIGLEVSVCDNIFLLYAKNYNGYKTLIKLATIKTSRSIELTDLVDGDVLVIVPYDYINIYDDLSKIYSDIYIGYSNRKEEKEALLYSKNVVFLRKCLYFNDKEKEYLKYLYMIRDGKTLSDDVSYDVDNSSINIDDIYSYTSNENLFNTNRIVDKCELEFPKSEVLLPIYHETNGLSSFEYLKELASFGLNKRLDGKVTNNYIDRLNYELDIINRMGFSNYFLVVYDFIKYAKKNNILVGPGRGSGAGSLVCFCLGITEIDPIKYNLLFERFLNPERITMPDIDTDFPDIYRDQVIDYVRNKYGEKKVSGIVTFGTLAPKQAIRDVARVFNIEPYQVDLITKKIPAVTKLKLDQLYNTNKELKEVVDSREILKKVYKIAQFFEGYPRHISSHAAGIIISKVDLDEVIPLVKSNDMYLSQYPMEFLEELGLLKMDFLGLTTLTTIMNIISDIKKYENVDISFNQIPLDDKKVLDIFKNAKTVGIFQFESTGMKNFLKRLKPNNLEDIFAAIALFRPGPVNNIDTYIRRKHGQESITYLDDSLEDILRNTYGVIIYQEQIMQIAVRLAGYSYGEADILRRAMSKKKKDVLEKEETKFINKSIENGYTYDTAKKIYDLILEFANYGFNRSHSIAYSIIAYKMAYLKYYYPKYFYANLLTSVINNESKEKEYINEAKSLNIKILKPSINKSNDKFMVLNNEIYFPLSAIKNIGISISREIINNRLDGYSDIYDFLSKNSKINKKTLETLILAGCFDEFNFNRKTLIDNIDELINYKDLVFDLDKDSVLIPEIKKVDEYSNDELITMEKELFGLYISNHPVSNYKAKYDNIMSLEDISSLYNKEIDVIVLVDYVKKINTKQGEEMVFFDGSDEYNKVSFTVFPKIYSEISKISVGDIVKIKGHVEKRYNEYQIVVRRIEKLN